jgi:uncharacterized protein
MVKLNNMKLDKSDIKQILLGASLLGTGGGGRYDLAQNILREMSGQVMLTPIDTLKETDLIITAFMVGGLKKRGDLGRGIAKSINILKTQLKKEIRYIIPVEIGPTAVMNIFNIAAMLNLTVIDGDLVGFRSAPEIYVEAITLNNVNRLPIVAVNLEGDTIILTETSSITKIESILRSFSDQSESEVYVAGYPIYKNMIRDVYGDRSLSVSRDIGGVLLNAQDDKTLIAGLQKTEILYLDRGIIINQDDKDEGGFTRGQLTIETENSIYEVFYKNEFLVLEKDKKVVLTSPDSILILDSKQMRGINNSEDNRQKSVYILARKATKPWRTKEGKKLFSPINLGYNVKQKLLLQ